MIKFIVKFWPAITPIALLLLWKFYKKKKKGGSANATDEKRDLQIWLYVLLLSFCIAIVVLLLMRDDESIAAGKKYIPAQIKTDGTFVSGHFEDENDDKENTKK